MTKSIEVSGRTEDEAIESALEQLGLTRDDVSVELIERAKTGFLGLKNTPAVVRVFYEAKEDRVEQVEVFLAGLLKRMDVEADMEVSGGEDSIEVVLTGKDPGSLIGRRGETLDAIQHLTNYVINHGNAGRVRVNLDAENYRQRRNETLETLASRTASKVLKYRRNMTLDPMNAYERHVIHTALQDHENISTYSIGSEPNRRVVVAYGSNKENTGHTNEFTGRTNEHSGRSNEHAGRPSGRPNEHTGRSSGRPNEHSGRSNEHTERPTENTGRSNENPGQSGGNYREWR